MTAATRVPLTSGVLHVESTGEPGDRLVLCVHGLSANCRSFDRLVPTLVAAGHHVVTLDLRGRGRSDISPAGSYGWYSHVRDLMEIADHYGAESFDLIGHSMGGFIGMALATQHPARCDRLVLIDVLGVPEPAALVAIGRSVGRLGQTFPSRTAAQSAVRDFGAIASWNDFWANYFDWELEPTGDDGVRIRTDVTAISEDSADAANHDVYALWGQIRCPILLVRAATPMGPGGGLVVSAGDAQRFAAEVPTATVIDVDADHYTVLLDPAAIAAIEAFTTRDR